MGRRGQSNEVREAKGDPGRRGARAEKAKVEDARALAGIPADLSDKAAQIWKAIAPELQRIKFLRDTDKNSFARYCQYLTEWWVHTKKLEEEGTTQVTDSNNVRMIRNHPSFNQRLHLENKLMGLEDRFGMNPSSRQQILMRMAGLVPSAPAGQLPLEQPKESDDLSNPNAGRNQSPIGVLRNNVPTVN
jgi:P27 family predicted phage terminase small subunit